MNIIKSARSDVISGTRVLAVLLLPLILVACVAAPIKQPAPPTAPDEWQAEATTGDVGNAWLRDFDSPPLENLVDQALRNNPDLTATRARARAAAARARIAGAGLLPEVDIGLSVGRGSGADRTPDDSFRLEAGIVWDADLWGRLDAAARAAALDALASEQDYRRARQQLAADIAKLWFQATETRQQLNLANNTRDSFQRSLKIIVERYQRGLSSALDVRLARSDLAAAEANKAARERELDAVLRQLDVDLGVYPGARLTAESDLPELVTQVPAGLPSQLLARRADLLAAEQRLSAAGQRLEQARKNRLPSLRLTARGGTASNELRNMLNWHSLVWNLLAGLTQPVFQGGRLEAERLLARAEHRQAWAGYAKTLLEAFQEVESSLAAESRYRRQEEALKQATVEARAAESLAESRYRQGLENIITLLDARRRAFNAESTWLLTARQRLDNRVDLYLALGGGFGLEYVREDDTQP